NPKDHNGRPHARKSGVLLGGVANAPIRPPNRVQDQIPLPLGASERPDRVRGLQPVGNGVYGDLARHLPSRMSTHAVGHDRGAARAMEMPKSCARCRDRSCPSVRAESTSPCTLDDFRITPLSTSTMRALICRTSATAAKFPKISVWAPAIFPSSRRPSFEASADDPSFCS